MSHPVKVDVYCFCYNESRIAPFIMDYWARFATNVHVYDNNSTDGVQDMLCAEKRFNVEVRHYDSEDKLNDGIITGLRNSVWKQSRGAADFVVVCDFDEALYSKDMMRTLQTMMDDRKTICAPIIYELMSERLPEHVSEELLHGIIGRGVMNMAYGKHILFDPNLINEINYLPGAHVCNPTGVVDYYDNKDVFLFHCKRIDIDLFKQKFMMMQSRMSETNRRNGWGVQYLAAMDVALMEYYEMMKNSIQLPI